MTQVERPGVSTRMARIRAVVVFYAEVAVDDEQRDGDFDDMTEGIERALDAVTGVAVGSVSVPDMDEIPEEAL